PVRRTAGGGCKKRRVAPGRGAAALVKWAELACSNVRVVPVTVVICGTALTPISFSYVAVQTRARAMTRARAEEYRRLAQECLALARTVSTREARANFVAMAETWLRLAEEQDQGSALTVPPPPAEQPAMQQQQQVQPKHDDKKE